MQRSEDEALSSCAVCGAAVEPGTDRAFVSAGAHVLCFDCALERGGIWAEDEDRWAQEPSIGGLPREEP